MIPPVIVVPTVPPPTAAPRELVRTGSDVGGPARLALGLLVLGLLMVGATWSSTGWRRPALATGGTGPGRLSAFSRGGRGPAAPTGGGTATVTLQPPAHLALPSPTDVQGDDPEADSDSDPDDDDPTPGGPSSGGPHGGPPPSDGAPSGGGGSGANAAIEPDLAIEPDRDVDLGSEAELPIAERVKDILPQASRMGPVRMPELHPPPGTAVARPEPMGLVTKSDGLLITRLT